jgi:HSP20 family molecular chaperone IbpA
MKLKQNILHIFGRSKTEGEDGFLSEMKFDKKFSFGDAVDTKNIIANMKDGVLRLTLPKLPKADSQTENIYQIKINTGTTDKDLD